MPFRFFYVSLSSSSSIHALSSCSPPFPVFILCSRSLFHSLSYILSFISLPFYPLILFIFFLFHSFSIFLILLPLSFFFRFQLSFIHFYSFIHFNFLSLSLSFSFCFSSFSRVFLLLPWQLRDDFRFYIPLSVLSVRGVFRLRSRELKSCMTTRVTSRRAWPGNTGLVVFPFNFLFC